MIYIFIIYEITFDVILILNLHLKQNNMNLFLVTLGSNTDEGEKLISLAIEQIKTLSVDAEFSSVYKSVAEGHSASKEYFNSVGIVSTDKSLSFWEEFFKQQEQLNGRDSEARKNHIVPLDIDITIWNQEVIRPANLKMNYIKKGLRQLTSKTGYNIFS